MAHHPILILSKCCLSYGSHPILKNVDLIIRKQDRIGLVGRNGSGKSSLLKLLKGELTLDSGNINRLSEISISMLDQEPNINSKLTVLEAIYGQELDINKYDTEKISRAKKIIEDLDLIEDSIVSHLSGGSYKKIALAKLIIEEPDLLILDEPTNHIDIDTIKYLEKVLVNWKKTLIVVTHDRRFLDIVTNKIIELDRGKIISFPGNWSKWIEYRNKSVESEKHQYEKLNKFILNEEEWALKGVEARRTRNEGRLRRLEDLREKKASLTIKNTSVNLFINERNHKGKIISELKSVNKSYGDSNIISMYSGLILKKDRIGIIGPNGSGKTTLIKIILGKLEVNSGSVIVSEDASVAYFDQMRLQLDDNKSIEDNINYSGEWITLGKNKKHINNYLEDFLFSAGMSKTPVRMLSGGEKSRVVLAKLFLQPANVLVLDEPTNDLDIETIEILEKAINDYSGTVILASHDRSFIENTINKSIIYAGQGKWINDVGKFEYEIPRNLKIKDEKNSNLDKKEKKHKNIKPDKINKQKIQPWELEELRNMPFVLQKLEEEQSELAKKLEQKELYTELADLVPIITNKLNKINDEIKFAFDRWQLLESKNEK
ncbi:ABC transporter ATP-binding protein [Candidatus Kinetoplastibacterium oncopeltii TCC290E]|uniref:ABC transporter ATP-binding protein n=1 Tax=Candidatus Kinetoplastidibacterium stringomonadis TCC290E TaxID=1208920 RepID=M1LZM6_9PROT|nr:ABC-F family ATP-binding cassette domain-containing protein [Candidatus Kinetoplastibacterium oncopeltii]AGF48559.1 ABC transporter ATP-binding protein [Candidatus Kinetoplastibacterium oncopeltii TCC290E]